MKHRWKKFVDSGFLKNMWWTHYQAFMTVKYCPFQETVPVSLQVCLTMSQKILETFEGIDKKDLNQEKIASTVSLI